MTANTVLSKPASHRRTTTMVPLALAGALLASAIGLMASGAHAGSTQLTTPNVIANTAKGSLIVPGHLLSGLVHFQLKDGAQPGSIILARLNKGVTAAKFQAALRKDQNAAFALVTFEGGAESGPQGSAAVTVQLPAGTYLAAIQAAAPQPSLSFFTVQAGQGALIPPRATVMIREVDKHHRLSYDMPSVVPAGRDILEVANTDDSSHEFQLARLHPGKSVKDLEVFFQSGMKGPAPADMVGGVPPVAGNSTTWLETTLTPGTYAAACSMQNTPTSKPHWMLGMIKAFTVR